MTLAPAGTMLEHALQYAADDIDVFPLWWPQHTHGVWTCACPRGTDCTSPAKHPLTSTGFKDATTNREQIREWWTRWPDANIGVPTGRRFDVIDIDGAAAAWQTLTNEHGTPAYDTLAVTGRGTGGFHYYCAPGGHKTIPSGKHGLPAGVEIKGIGGYVVAPPSRHATGRRYQWLTQTPTPGIPWHDWYTAVTSNPDPEPRPATRHTPPVDPQHGNRYGAAVLTRACDLLRDAVEGTRWNTLVHDTVPLAVRAIAGGCLDRPTALTAVQHAAHAAGLDPTEIQRIPHLFAAMEAAGITDPIAPAPDPNASLDTWINNLPSISLDPAYTDAADALDRDRTSWWPRNLNAVLNGHDPEPAPTYLARLDGRNLFYPGKINGLIGESESGKTWVALLAVHQALQDGHTVLYLDFEDTASGIITRLQAMGSTHEHLEQLIYISPDEAFHPHAQEDLAHTLTQHTPNLIILDGFNAAMTLLGYDINSNTDATKFAQQLLKPLAQTSACLIYVDHVPKSKEARGKGGIGAQAKRAMTTGSALAVDIIDPFGRGMTGRLKLTVDKDRPGHVRAFAIAAKHVGIAVLTSRPDGSIDIEIENASDTDDLTLAQAVDMRNRVIAAARSFGDEPFSKTEIATRMKATKRNVIPVIDELIGKNVIVETAKLKGGYPLLRLNPDPDQEVWDL